MSVMPLVWATEAAGLSQTCRVSASAGRAMESVVTSVSRSIRMGSVFARTRARDKPRFGRTEALRSGKVGQELVEHREQLFGVEWFEKTVADPDLPRSVERGAIGGKDDDG